MTRAAGYMAALAALLVASPGVVLAEKVAGVALPDGARRIGENRYQVDRTYEEVLRFYRSICPPAVCPRRPVADQPGVRAVHIENPAARPGSWEGVNVYELNGETRLFVLVKQR